MFDVHYHLLFGVDDGPKSLDGSVALAEASIAEGVTHIVATPHANSRYPFDPVANQQKIQILNQRFSGRLTIGSGCDFHLSYENFTDLERNPTKYSVNGKQYLLVELADFAIPISIPDLLFQIRSMGLTPVITHPERNPVLASEPQRLDEWIAGGSVVQVTAASFCGDFGPKTARVALDMVRNGRVHLVASDAHSVKWRPPSMRRAYELLQSKFGEMVADPLCLHNPRAVFLGEQVQELPKAEQKSLYVQGRGMLSRLFGK